MSADLALATKRCTKCGDVKPLSEFHRQRSMKDGHRSECKPCVLERVRKNTARRRAEMGEEAWLAHQRDIVRKVRQDPARRERERLASEAYTAAWSALRDAHRTEFDALLARERYERGLD